MSLVQFVCLQESCGLVSRHKHDTLAEPEARLYNHQPDPPAPAPHPGANVCFGYISAIFQRNELKFCMMNL